jgi:hypothetical protein
MALAGTSDGAPMVIRHCDGSAGQVWGTDFPAQRIRHLASGPYLTSLDGWAQLAVTTCRHQRP